MDDKVRFGLFEFDRQARELRLSGQRVPLQIQPLRVLEVLLERAGEVVSRADLRAEVWPPTVYLDFDHGLDNAMTRLRQALSDSADTPRFIETLPRVGFRFIHVLEPCGTRKATTSARRIPQRSITWLLIAAMAASFIIVIAFMDSTGFGIGAKSETAGVQRPTENAEAYDAYLRGVEFFEQRNKESISLSITHLTHATLLDPDFAAAYAALAMAYTMAGGNTALQFLNAGEVLAPALNAAERALNLNPNLASAHVALAGVLNQLEPWSAANDVAIEQSFRRALELDGTNSNTALFFGNFLATRKRGEEAIAQFRRAHELSPLSPSINSRLGMQLLAAGRTAEGLQYLQKTVELDPFQFNAQIRVGWAYITVGELGLAERAFHAAERTSPSSVRSQAGLAYIAARNGDEFRASELLRSVQPVAEALDDPFEVAIIYVGLEDRENSLIWLARTARQARTFHSNVPWGLQSPIFDWLRDDARFAQIERDITTARGRFLPIE